MRVCGVICEYNPFHRGHEYHLARARALTGADYVVCVMSGALTQRGLFARHDKWTRARAALLHGADLVLELPARFACAPAPDFARGGVMTLAGLGAITHLSFGCEAGALPHLARAAEALRVESPAFRLALREALDRGLPYPRARALALQRACGADGMAGDIAAPNAALALEYLCALPDGIEAVPITREGAGYHDAQLTGLSSAAGIRAALESGREAEALHAVPCPALFRDAEARGDIHLPGALDTALLSRLRAMTAGELRGIWGMDEGLEHRFIAAAGQAATRDALIHAVKSKRYTYARLSRLCANVLLNVTRDFAAANDRPAYARVLGFRREAAPLLHAIKQRGALPLVTKTADFAHPLLALDVRAQDLWALGCASLSLRGSGRDFRTSPIISD